ncbi:MULTISPECIES: PHP-associated domain-containing protein [unclassified Methanoculleus]|uniref:PHP domain-containing protein n=1 Tax=unclassified Methanoculleus TaxID=2619537 RepID=UPI0025E59DC7|nr:MULTISPECIES: PHP-associated domain-containing protein [unclassified Methanoculleus]MCK9317457.1 PHP domain-containing protein [Methanoculleus sp.]MDD2252991.1 PHP-associated domain-containing protein [Methanoculleus sp.]MDD2788739.1 PHP-associated domain-containing protein [Methanoculleus sp.]MDD3215966.1 PHP-associated domain-containing protein [Methanoculleus sp.]MDD4313716.1 PHP-associated domain-containing protein [Methanoculleus sp.]
MHYYKDIIFEKPLPKEIRRLGLLPADLHVHTRHSDSATRVRDVLKLAARQGIGLAITDHNQVSGVAEAKGQKIRVTLVPGIEVSANDGPHLLLYFYSVSDLQDFYRRHIEKNRRNGPFTAIRLDTPEILDRREDYSCIAVEAHPCGYAFLNRGVERCVAGACIGKEVFSRLDALEVICGGMARSHNMKAAGLAAAHDLGRTGGTDGHLLHELGGVVTCAEADTVDEFLDAVRARKTVIIGRERPFVEKAVMGTAVLPHHLPYAVSILQARWEQSLPRIRKFVESRLNNR